MRAIAFLLAGLLSGILSGLFGIGGGILLIPILIYVFGFDQHEAQGTTLAAMIPPIGLFAAIEYYRHGHMRLEAVPGIILGFALGAYLGAVLAPQIAGVWLRRGFGLLLCYVGIDFLLTDLLPGRFWPAALVTTVLGLLAEKWRRRRCHRGSTPTTTPTPPQDYVL